MKASELKSILTKINKLGIKKDPLPSATLIEIYDGKLTAYSTKLQTGYSYFNEEFKDIDHALIDFEFISKLASKFKKDWDISFTKENELIIISTPKGVFELVNSSLSWDFKFKTPKELGIITSKNISLMKKASNYTACDVLRPVMNHILLDRSNNEDMVIASDAHTLCFYEADRLPELNHNKADQNKLLIPKHVIQLLENKTDYKLSQPNSDNISEWYYYLSSGNETIFFKPEEGNYPTWRAVIPESNNKHLYITNTTDLKEKLDMVMITKPSNFLAELYLSEKESIIKTNDVDYGRKYQSTIQSNFTGEEISIGVSAQRLLAILNTEKYDNCTISLSDSNRAMIINDEVLLMPMMIVN